MLKVIIGIPLIILYFSALTKIKDWRVPPVIFGLMTAITLPAYASIEYQNGEIVEMLACVSGLSIIFLFIDFYMLLKIRKEWIKYNNSPYIGMGYNTIQTFHEFYTDDINHNHPTY